MRFVDSVKPIANTMQRVAIAPPQPLLRQQLAFLAPFVISYPPVRRFQKVKYPPTYF